MFRRHVKFCAPGLGEVKQFRKHVVAEASSLLGWIRNNKDGSVEMLVQGADENAVNRLVSFSVSEAERWLGVVVTIETVVSEPGAKPLKQFDVGHSGSPL